ncbi:MAG: hypothetical protein Q4G23_10805 [Clostridia bacterium]|nr:hypothetical protein [Clostridia bacterium]
MTETLDFLCKKVYNYKKALDKREIVMYNIKDKNNGGIKLWKRKI